MMLSNTLTLGHQQFQFPSGVVEEEQRGPLTLQQRACAVDDLLGCVEGIGLGGDGADDSQELVIETLVDLGNAGWRRQEKRREENTC